MYCKYTSSWVARTVFAVFEWQSLSKWQNQKIAQLDSNTDIKIVYFSNQNQLRTNSSAAHLLDSALRYLTFLKPYSDYTSQETFSNVWRHRRLSHCECVCTADRYCSTSLAVYRQYLYSMLKNYIKEGLSQILKLYLENVFDFKFWG